MILLKKAMYPLLIQDCNMLYLELNPRHLVLNNLPGRNKFCPLITKSRKLGSDIATKNDLNINKNKLFVVCRDILQSRASTYLMFKRFKGYIYNRGRKLKQVTEQLHGEYCHWVSWSR